jgi:cell fate regulator YaaT (PSP1 superfamily)
MTKVVGIRFKPAGKIYDFDAGHFVLHLGDRIIVETQQGLGMGVVAVPPFNREDDANPMPLAKVFRMAQDADFIQQEKNAQNEKLAHEFCMRCIRQLDLHMNLFAVESAFDGTKMTFFFTSENRVDFRQLVKMLVKQLGVRIEMRQVGIRNQARICGGIGRCGREICCSSFLNKFGPVSIRMAKEQGLSLNPAKISGQCGRLMCCLTYEYETYLSLREKLPKIGKMVTTPNGRGKIVRHNPICNRVSVRFEDGVETEVPVSDIVMAPAEEKS